MKCLKAVNSLSQKGRQTFNHVFCKDIKLYPGFKWMGEKKTKIISILFQTNIHTKIIPKHTTILTYMSLGCKMKDYVNLLSFKKLFYKMRFTNIPLNSKKKKIVFFSLNNEYAVILFKHHKQAIMGGTGESFAVSTRLQSQSIYLISEPQYYSFFSLIAITEN